MKIESDVMNKESMDINSNPLVNSNDFYEWDDDEDQVKPTNEKIKKLTSFNLHMQEPQKEYDSSNGANSTTVIKTNSFYSQSTISSGKVSYSTIRKEVLNQKKTVYSKCNRLMDTVAAKGQSKVTHKKKIRNQRKKPYTRKKPLPKKELPPFEREKLCNGVFESPEGSLAVSSEDANSPNNIIQQVEKDVSYPNSISPMFSPDIDSEDPIRLNVSKIITEISRKYQSDSDSINCKRRENSETENGLEKVQINANEIVKNETSPFSLYLETDSANVDCSGTCSNEEDEFSSDEKIDAQNIDTDDTGVSLCMFIDKVKSMDKETSFVDEGSSKKRKLPTDISAFGSKAKVLVSKVDLTKHISKDSHGKILLKEISFPSPKHQQEEITSEPCTEERNCRNDSKKKSNNSRSYFNESSTGLLKYFKKATMKKEIYKKEKPKDNENGERKSPKLLSQQLICDVEHKVDSLSSPKQPLKKEKRLSSSPRNGNKKLEQLYIDVGQKNFGHTTCETCGMVYTKTLPEDTLEHSKYHQKLMQKLKFKGWKAERVLQEFHDGRIIQINSDDNSLHLKKVSDLRDVVDRELGFACATTENSSAEKVFMFVSNKKIVGCAIAVPVTKAYPVITSQDAPSPEKRNGVPTLSWCCSSTPVPALCGISRIWVLKQARRQKVAERLVDAIRSNFIYGVLISKDKVAFSDPTPDGRVFAEKYTGTAKILVFR